MSVAKFCELHVAAKFLYESDYNGQQFVQEMTMTANLRHPHFLLLFCRSYKRGTNCDTNRTNTNQPTQGAWRVEKCLELT